MNGTHIGIILLLIINIIIVFVSIITNGILNRVYDDNQHLRHYVKELEEELNKMGFDSITLGNRIMRVETVPLFLLSIINYEFME